MKKSKERGAIVVEATLTLTLFIFTIFTILMIVDIYYIQAKMSVALNSAAKEISQYSYLYYKLGVDQLESDLAEGAAEARDTANQTIDGVGTMMNSLSGAGSALQSGDFDTMMNEVETTGQTVESLVNLYGERIGDDPKQFIAGMGKLAGSELSQEAKTALGQVLAKTFMKKNLASYKGQDADAFLKKHRVDKGMAGLDFNYTSLMAYGTTDQILLVVTYDVNVVKLLNNMDFKFTFRQCAKTTAWDNGISGSQVEEATEAGESIWDESNSKRGHYIQDKETASCTYLSSGNGFNGYNQSNNEFVNISSINTHAKSYTGADADKNIKKRINEECNKVINGVKPLGETLTLKDSSGKSAKVSSPKSSRVYKVVIVVPEDADKASIQSIANQVAAQKAKKGYTVTIEVKTGYGVPSPPKAEADTSAESAAPASAAAA